MSIRQLSIQWKITLLSGLCLLAIVTLLVGLSLYRMEHNSELVKASSAQMLNESAQARIEAQGEAQALAESALRLLQDRTLCERMGQAGRARAAQHFSHEVMMTRLEALVTRALSDFDEQAR